MKGEGLILNLVTNVVDSLASRLLRSAPSTVVEFLSKHGNEVVETLRLERHPIGAVYHTIVNLVSRGKFAQRKKKLKYDQVYHLYLVINGRWIVEKNSKVEFKRFAPRERFEAQHLAASGVRRDLNTMMKNLEQKTEAPKIWRYNPVTANCQHFIQDLLRSNGWLTHYANEFIKQDTKELLKDTPALHNLTDAGALLSKIID